MSQALRSRKNKIENLPLPIVKGTKSGKRKQRAALVDSSNVLKLQHSPFCSNADVKKTNLLRSKQVKENCVSLESGDLEKTKTVSSQPATLVDLTNVVIEQPDILIDKKKRSRRDRAVYSKDNSVSKEKVLNNSIISNKTTLDSSLKIPSSNPARALREVSNNQESVSFSNLAKKQPSFDTLSSVVDSEPIDAENVPPKSHKFPIKKSNRNKSLGSKRGLCEISNTCSLNILSERKSDQNISKNVLKDSVTSSICQKRTSSFACDEAASEFRTHVNETSDKESVSNLISSPFPIVFKKSKKVVSEFIRSEDKFIKTSTRDCPIRIRKRPSYLDDFVIGSNGSGKRLTKNKTTDAYNSSSLSNCFDNSENICPPCNGESNEVAQEKSAQKALSIKSSVSSHLVDDISTKVPKPIFVNESITISDSLIPSSSQKVVVKRGVLRRVKSSKRVEEVDLISTESSQSLSDIPPNVLGENHIATFGPDNIIKSALSSKTTPPVAKSAKTVSFKRKSSLKNRSSRASSGSFVPSRPGVRVPIYKTRRPSPPLTSVEAKKKMYSFEVDENEEPVVKKKKKLVRTQKVRKRARIVIRQKYESKVNKAPAPLLTKVNNINYDDADLFEPVQNDDIVDHNDSIVTEDVAKIQSPEKASPKVSTMPYQSTPARPDLFSSAMPSPRFSIASPAISSPIKSRLHSTPATEKCTQRFSNVDEDIIPESACSPMPVFAPPSIHEVSYQEVPENAVQAARASRSLLCRTPRAAWDDHVSYKYCSTPIRENSYNISAISMCSPAKPEGPLDISTCFGFDLPDEVEEELCSPIKKPGPARVVVPAAKPDPLPLIEEVLALLKEGDDSNPAPPFCVPEVDFSSEKELPVNSTTFSSSVNISIQRTPKRSYERPPELRRGFVDEEELPAFPMEVHVPQPAVRRKKRQPGPSVKEQNDFEKWAESFNNQCAEISSFALCIE